MDMKISGSGQITSGEYDNIKISGSGNLHGLIRCLSLHCSGAAKCDGEIECKNDISVSGSSKFGSTVKAGNLTVSGSVSGDNDMTVCGELKSSGSIKCGGSVRCRSLIISGKGDVEKDIEAESIKVSGKINCGGLMNGENIEIEFISGMEIGSIGGSKICIYPNYSEKRRTKLPLFSSIVRTVNNSVTVNNSIEGDSIALECVNAKRVSGRIVAIGDDCNIDLLQYSEKVEISPKAKVRRTEKIR